MKSPFYRHQMVCTVTDGASCTRGAPERKSRTTEQKAALMGTREGGSWLGARAAGAAFADETVSLSEVQCECICAMLICNSKKLASRSLLRPLVDIEQACRLRLGYSANWRISSGLPRPANKKAAREERQFPGVPTQRGRCVAFVNVTRPIPRQATAFAQDCPACEPAAPMLRSHRRPGVPPWVIAVCRRPRSRQEHLPRRPSVFADRRASF